MYCLSNIFTRKEWQNVEIATLEILRPNRGRTVSRAQLIAFT